MSLNEHLVDLPQYENAYKWQIDFQSICIWLLTKTFISFVTVLENH